MVPQHQNPHRHLVTGHRVLLARAQPHRQSRRPLDLHPRRIISVKRLPGVQNLGSRSRKLARRPSLCRRHGHPNLLLVWFLNLSILPVDKFFQAPEPPKGPAALEQAPMRTSDPLQVAAQVYPWMHMSSTLDACFKDAEAAATVRDCPSLV